MSENQKQLRVVNLEKTFFTKITDSITKIFLPTQLSFNAIMISVKRNNCIKAHKEYIEDTSSRKDIVFNKYENLYALYLEAVDKYVFDSIYKKVKKNVASSFEANALSRYYDIVHLKETEYTEYKYQKQKYLLDLELENVKLANKEKTMNLFSDFYCYKSDGIYKALLKHYSVQLADTSNKDKTKVGEIHNKIFKAIEEYIENVLQVKAPTQNTDEILTEYNKLNKFKGSLSKLEYIEKNMILLGISRSLFAHSFPLIAAEDCYIYLLKQTRQLLLDEKESKEKVFKMLIKLIEDYNIRLLSTKVYWDKPIARQGYKIFWEKYNKVKQDEKEKQILFLKHDLIRLNHSKKDYSKIVKFYKEKLVKLGAIGELKNRARTFRTGMK